MCIDFIWYYPRNKDYPGCFQIVDYSEWYRFFDNLNRTGQINWNYNGKPETFFSSSLQSVLDSSLVKDPVRLQGIFQGLYDSANRSYVDKETQKLTPVGRINLQRIAEDDCRTATTTTRTTTTASTASTTTAGITARTTTARTTTTAKGNSAGRGRYEMVALLMTVGMGFLV